MLNYVLLLVVDTRCENIVSIVKKKGPSYLLEKHTFPGGKIEGDEPAYLAASREMMEETNVQVPAKFWTTVDVVQTPEYRLTTLFAVSDRLADARQMEIEPVQLLNIRQAMKDAQASPQLYTDDFVKNLGLALAQFSREKELTAFRFAAPCPSVALAA